MEGMETKEKQPRGAKRQSAETLISKAAEEKKPLTTVNGAKLRMDLYGVSLQGHPEEGAGGDPCPVCRNHRGIRLEPLNEYLPISSIEEARTVNYQKYDFSDGQLTKTPVTTKQSVIRHNGFSRKFHQKCGCGAALGHIWQYAPELHGKTLVDFYFSV